jgi:hypothetical protein
MLEGFKRIPAGITNNELMAKDQDGALERIKVLGRPR